MLIPKLDKKDSEREREGERERETKCTYEPR